MASTASTFITRPVSHSIHDLTRKDTDGILCRLGISIQNRVITGNAHPKGNLGRNLLINTKIRIELLESPTFAYTRMLQEIHDLRITPYDAWDKQDWLCLDCIVEILRSHYRLQLWLLVHLVKRKSQRALHD